MKLDIQDIEANYINQKLDRVERLNKLNRIKPESVEIITFDKEYTTYFEHRDAYCDIIRNLKDKDLRHAIAIVGLRRTGKSIILNQLHLECNEFGISESNILHISLGAKVEDKSVSRNEIDIARLNNKKVVFPTLQDINEFIQKARAIMDLKCLLIDEITLCEDLILGGKSFIDGLLDSGIKVVLAGTESLSLQLANEQSLYTRLILEDITYIPFAEYCRLKKISIKTNEEKKIAMDKYIQHGNVLDDTIDVDDRYLEDALGINVALSIINSDNVNFYDYEDNYTELVQLIIKYYKLIGDSITVPAVNKAISRADISRAIENENKRRKENQEAQINFLKPRRTNLAVTGAERYFENYNLNFDVSQIKLSDKQLEVIDNQFSKMGLLYNLSTIPKNDPDDICEIHSLAYNITLSTIQSLVGNDYNISDSDAEILMKEMESALYGRLLENIIGLQYIKAIESKNKLLKTIKSYNNQFNVERKCTNRYMYKYNNKVEIDGNVYKAEVDLVLNEDAIKLIEIKKSSIVDEHQTRWLNNETVVQEISNKISTDKKIEKFVYYLGESKDVDGIKYINVVDKLIEHYNLYLKK